MGGFAGVAGPAGLLWQYALTQPAYWRARYGMVSATAVAEGATATPDPHSPSGIARCPVCFNDTLQRSASSVCTTCYGTGWTGGYANTTAIQTFITQGTFTLKLEESGELVAVTGIWCRHDPAVALLPQDVLMVPGQSTRYLVGELVQRYGVGVIPFAQMVQLLPVATDSPLQHVPIP